MSMFYPKSIDFIKNRAKILKKIYPELPLTQCQYATSVAMGFTDLFDATKRIHSTNNRQSLPDDEVSDDVRLLRRYQQSRALIDILNLAPDDVDYLVRSWNLTSNKPSHLNDFKSDYNLILDEINAIARGDISEDDDDSLYDDPPAILAPGVIHAVGSIKHQYLYLSNELIISMPIYLRGNFSTFLDFEGGHHVVCAFPHLFTTSQRIEAELYLKRNQPRLYEWHFNLPSEAPYQIPLSRIIAEAQAYPSEWIPLSFRYEKTNMLDSPVYLPSINGSDFIKFIKTGGSLKGLTLKWFKAKQGFGGADAFDYPDIDIEHLNLSVTLNRDLIIETTPLYSSPFKHGPMSDMEYHPLAEGGAMMLHEELPKDDF